MAARGIDDAEQQHFNWHCLPRVLLKNGGATPLAKTATGTGKKVGKGLRGLNKMGASDSWYERPHVAG